MNITLLKNKHVLISSRNRLRFVYVRVWGEFLLEAFHDGGNDEVFLGGAAPELGSNE